MAMIASALFIDGKLARCMQTAWTKQPCFQLLNCMAARQSYRGKVRSPASKGEKWDFWSREMTQNGPGNANSLIGRRTSLIARSNSLQACNEFPVRIRREFRDKPL